MRNRTAIVLDGDTNSRVSISNATINSLIAHFKNARQDDYDARQQSAWQFKIWRQGDKKTRQLASYTSKAEDTLITSSADNQWQLVGDINC